jgi:hypothetical protein
MFKEFDRRLVPEMWEADQLDLEATCPNSSPRTGYWCLMPPGHYPTTNHMAGIGFGYVIAEWDDDRSTDGED